MSWIKIDNEEKKAKMKMAATRALNAVMGERKEIYDDFVEAEMGRFWFPAGTEELAIEKLKCRPYSKKPWLWFNEELEVRSKMWLALLEYGSEIYLRAEDVYAIDYWSKGEVEEEE